MSNLKSITIQRQEAVRLYFALQQIEGKEVNARLAYWLGRTSTNVEKKVAELDQLKKSLFEKYAKVDESGAIMYNENKTQYIWKYGETPDPEMLEILKALSEEEIKIDVFTVSVDDFNDIKLPMNVMGVIGMHLFNA